MSDLPTEYITIDPEVAIVVRNRLVSLSQCLGFDYGTSADVPTPPTAIPPEEIAPLLGELPRMLDATISPALDTVTVSVRAVPTPDWDELPVPACQRQVFDDCAAHPTTTSSSNRRMAVRLTRSTRTISTLPTISTSSRIPTSTSSQAR